MYDIKEAFAEANVLSPASILAKRHFTIQFSEEYKATVFHYHNYAQLWFVTEGTLVHTLGNKQFIQTPGSVVFVPPYVPHIADTVNSEVVPRYGQASFLDCALTDCGYSFFSYHPKFCHFESLGISSYFMFEEKNRPILDEITNRLFSEFSKTSNHIPKLIPDLLAELFRHITRESKAICDHSLKHIYNRSIAVKRAFEYMAEHYSEKILLSDLCDAANMEKSFLATSFREITGKTAFEILTAIRIKNAFQSLLYSDLKLSDIAKIVGFSTKSRLSHEFSKRYGCPPMEFRRRFQTEYLELDKRLAIYWEQFDDRQ